MRQGRLGNALAWALKAQDSGFITYIADQFLKRYAEHGELDCRDLLENLGFCMMASDRLTFLGKSILKFELRNKQIFIKKLNFYSIITFIVFYNRKVLRISSNVWHWRI